MNKSRLFISWELSAPISKVYICSRISFSNCLDIKNGLRLPCIASNDLGIKSVSTGSLAWYELSLVGRKIFLSFLVVATRGIENWAMDIVERIFGISLTIQYSCWNMSIAIDPNQWIALNYGNWIILIFFHRNVDFLPLIYYVKFLYTPT